MSSVREAGSPPDHDAGESVPIASSWFAMLEPVRGALRGAFAVPDGPRLVQVTGSSGMWVE
jgi:hypothetical protein